MSKQVTQPLTRLTGFSDDMQARGWEPGQRVLARGVHEADPEEALSLVLPPGELVVRLVRLRLADGVPLALEHAAVPGVRSMRRSLCGTCCRFGRCSTCAPPPPGRPTHVIWGSRSAVP